MVTRETVGKGELAQAGDYIKLDTTGMPYPAERTWFEENHICREDGLYLQKVTPRKAWGMHELLCPEICFLLEHGLLEMDREQGFRAQLWGTVQTAAPGGIVVLDRVETDGCGEILTVDFHFVAEEEFAATYEILSEA